jgi:hypothetical protein
LRPLIADGGRTGTLKHRESEQGIPSPDGWILTNEHVVGSSTLVDLRLPDGKIHQAKVVKTDEAADLALLKVDLASASWLAVSKGENDLQLGRTVLTVGYPSPWVQGVEPKYTDGKISAASGIGDRKDSYQTTVPVQHGNSGGALVDAATGWVVGLSARERGPAGAGCKEVFSAQLFKTKVPPFAITNHFDQFDVWSASETASQQCTRPVSPRMRRLFIHGPGEHSPTLRQPSMLTQSISLCEASPSASESAIVWVRALADSPSAKPRECKQ